MIAYKQIEQLNASDSVTKEEIVTITTETEKEQQQQEEKVDQSKSDEQSVSTTDESQVAKRELKQNDDGSYVCYSEKLKLNFTVHMQNDGKMASQRCYILTVHDLGFDYNEFQDLIMTPEMASLRSRIIWLHVNLPGQGIGDDDLKIKQYPSIEDLGEELATVLDYFKVPQAIVIGDGAGANVAVNFAVKCPGRCLGLALIEPIASQASFIEIMKHKIQHLNVFQKNNLNAHEKANLILNHVKRVNSNEHLSGSFNLNETEARIYENRNIKNLSLFAQSFINRASLLDHIQSLSVDVLTVSGKQSSAYHEAKKFHNSLQDSRRRNPRNMVNSPLLELDGLVKDHPATLATSFQYFLQGIGLISAMPMRRMSNSRQSSIASSNQSETTGSIASSTKVLPTIVPATEATTAPAATETPTETPPVTGEETSKTEATDQTGEDTEKPSSTSSHSETASQLVSSNPSLSTPE